MRIIYVENVRMPSERAHSYQIAQLCYELARLGHGVTLVTPDRAESKDLFAYYGFKEHNFTHRVLPTTDALQWKWMPQPMAYVIQRWTFLRNVRAWASSEHANIWYTRSPAVAAMLVNRASGALVLEAHDDPASHPSRWERIKKNIDLFVAISEGMRKHLVAKGVSEQAIIVAHDGVDLEALQAAPVIEARTKWNIPREAFLAVYTGGLYPWKGVDFLLSAWKTTPSNAYLLVIGGPDQDRERIKKLIPKEVRERIQVLPFIPREQVFSLLKEADLGVLPTSPQFVIGRDYTSPLKVFEYLAAGLPLLASDVPTSHEVLNDQVARFFSQVEASVGEQVTNIMRDKTWTNTASIEAQNLAATYTWQARAERIAQALKSIRSHR